MASHHAASLPVVIIGTGFGGLAAARQLAQAPFDVIIVDRHNYYLFSAVALSSRAGLSPLDIASPIRGILHRQRNASVILRKCRASTRCAGEVVAEGRRVPS